MNPFPESRRFRPGIISLSHWLGPVLLGLFFLSGPTAVAAQDRQVDVCVYGGTSGGVMAAVALAQQGRTVLLVEPGRRLGGMSSGGLGQTDIGNKQVIGGLSRTFYRRVGKAYGRDEAWTFEPHVAAQVFRDLVAENKVEVLFEHRLAKVEKEGRRIRRIILEKAPPDATGTPATQAESGKPITITAALFIDAGYEGDLLAGAGVSYTVGREAVSQYGESLNGIRPGPGGHAFNVRVDPYHRPGDPSSGLLPFIQEDGGRPGDGDRRVQAYNFRLCLTRDPKNQEPIRPPRDYDPARYELLARYLEALEAAGKKPSLGQLMTISSMPNGKTDINNNGPFSTDFIGGNWSYPDGDAAARAKIWKEHEDYTRGLLHFLATSPRVPAGVRRDMQSWGLCRDEFQDTGGWPSQLYIREARRLIGRYVVTQADCEHRRVAEDSIGMGAYNMDSHNCRRIVQRGAVQNEGDVQVSPRGPYPISYRAITPKAEECVNLLVPVCLSASHIAYGSIRMEPVFMVLGQSAGLAACQALEEKKTVQEIDVARLQRQLRAAGQILEVTR
ncbi:MAG: FAD-dependent oxidoreductase [Planctomycetes bacterium]|nr:FAD-dependent oxidoreductase [Planctomycetota bacterium]